ncbi:MAG: imidazole glycerol phosphate synthase subunit HisH [Planctomycetota bacterium]
MIGIIDYGAGNLLSIKKAMEHLGVKCRIINTKNKFKGITKVILPGVGAFQSAIRKLKSTGIYEITKDWLLSDKPFLGICLGMQLLFEESEESAGVKGFGVFKGKVIRFKRGKVPQIGWNRVHIKRKSKLMSNIKDDSFFYFLHGYFAKPADGDIITGTTEYNTVYPSMVERGNICGVQFHPEKSSAMGLKLLRNWVRNI